MKVNRPALRSIFKVPVTRQHQYTCVTRMRINSMYNAVHDSRLRYAFQGEGGAQDVLPLVQGRWTGAKTLRAHA